MTPDSPHDPQAVSDREESSSEKADLTTGPQGDSYLFHESRKQLGQYDNTSEQSTEQASLNNAVPSPLPPMPVFQYGTAPPPAMIPRTKRTQCKNACTNCQKACKKCDDNRPCQRCTRYGTADTCVDSKRKERKKGLKRGPYKKRDGKDHGSADGEDDHVHQPARGPAPAFPYVGPVAYPPGMWSTYAPTGHGGKLEATGYYQPVFTLTPVGAPLAHGGEGGSASGGSESQPHPFSFYPATFISYPGLPYPIPQAPGPFPPGFHFAYHAPGLFAPRPPGITNRNCEQNLSNSSTNGPVKEAADLNGAGDSEKETKAVESQVIEQVKVAESQAHDAARKEVD